MPAAPLPEPDAQPDLGRGARPDRATARAPGFPHDLAPDLPAVLPPVAPAPIDSGDPRHLGRSLRTWRALRRVKQDLAAQWLQVSQPTLSRWENGRASPQPDEARRLRALLGARLDSAADHTLARLVRQSAGQAHLICDLTHRLLAASPQRERQFHLPLTQLLGRPLWPYASDEIVQAEGRLAEWGWYEAAPPEVEFRTGRRDSEALLIQPSSMRWVRLQLSDGSFVRLVETVRLLD